MLRIKPVGKDYFKTSKVTIREIAQVRRAGVAIMAVRTNPDGTTTNVFLIPEPAKTLRKGSDHPAEHMDTGRKYGRHDIVNVCQFKYRSGVLEITGYEVGTRKYSDLFDFEAVPFQLA